MNEIESVNTEYIWALGILSMQYTFNSCSFNYKSNIVTILQKLQLLVNFSKKTNLSCAQTANFKDFSAKQNSSKILQILRQVKDILNSVRILMMTTRHRQRIVGCIPWLSWRVSTCFVLSMRAHIHHHRSCYISSIPWMASLSVWSLERNIIAC